MLITGISDILFEELREHGIKNHHNWVPRNYFESSCFTKDEEMFRPPLEIAATEMWEGLVQKLIDHGAEPRAKLYARPREPDVAELGFDQLSWMDRKSLYWDDPKAPLLRPILSDLLGTNAKHPRFKRRFQAARVLLAKSQTMPKRTLPKTVEELHVFLKNSTRVLKKPGQKLSEDVAELWEALSKEYQSLLPRVKDRKRSLVFLAALEANSSALKCFLDLGFSPNGRWWHRVSFTPYDAIRCQISPNATEDEEQPSRLLRDERTQCLRALEQRGAYRGPFYLVEFQFLFTTILVCLVTGLMIFTISLNFEIYGLSRSVVDYLINYLQSASSPIAFYLAWWSMFMLGWIYGIFLIGSFLALMFPVGQVMGALAGVFWLRLPFSAVVLHSSPLVWLLTLMVHNKNYAAVNHYTYGPTASILKTMFSDGSKTSRKHSVRHV